MKTQVLIKTIILGLTVSLLFAGASSGQTKSTLTWSQKMDEGSTVVILQPRLSGYPIAGVFEENDNRLQFVCDKLDMKLVSSRSVYHYRRGLLHPGNPLCDGFLEDLCRGSYEEVNAVYLNEKGDLKGVGKSISEVTQIACQK